MKLLKELLSLTEAEDDKEYVAVTKKVRASTYHKDYLKTKDKSYRKYDPEKRSEAKE